MTAMTSDQAGPHRRGQSSLSPLSGRLQSWNTSWDVVLGLLFNAMIVFCLWKVT